MKRSSFGAAHSAEWSDSHSSTRRHVLSFMLLWIDTTAAIALSSPPSAFPLRCSALKNICCDGYTQLLSPAPRGIDDVTRSVGRVDDCPGAGCCFGIAGIMLVGSIAPPRVHHRAAVRLRRRARARAELDRAARRLLGRRWRDCA